MTQNQITNRNIEESFIDQLGTFLLFFVRQIYILQDYGGKYES